MTLTHSIWKSASCHKESNLSLLYVVNCIHLEKKCCPHESADANALGLAVLQPYLTTVWVLCDEMWDTGGRVLNLCSPHWTLEGNKRSFSLDYDVRGEEDTRRICKTLHCKG